MTKKKENFHLGRAHRLICLQVDNFWIIVFISEVWVEICVKIKLNSLSNVKKLRVLILYRPPKRPKSEAVPKSEALLTALGGTPSNRLPFPFSSFITSHHIVGSPACTSVPI